MCHWFHKFHIKEIGFQAREEIGKTDRHCEPKFLKFYGSLVTVVKFCPE